MMGQARDYYLTGWGTEPYDTKLALQFAMYDFTGKEAMAYAIEGISPEQAYKDYVSDKGEEVKPEEKEAKE